MEEAGDGAEGAADSDSSEGGDDSEQGRPLRNLTVATNFSLSLTLSLSLLLSLFPSRPDSRCRDLPAQCLLPEVRPRSPFSRAATAPHPLAASHSPSLPADALASSMATLPPAGWARGGGACAPHGHPPAPTLAEGRGAGNGESRGGGLMDLSCPPCISALCMTDTYIISIYIYIASNLLSSRVHFPPNRPDSLPH